MCGVIGYKGNIKRETLEKIAYQSGIRGLHNLGRYTTQDGAAGIIHTRYITSGETNQPLTLGDSWMAFNGVIDMGTKEEIERKYSIKMETDNDGEIILQLCKTPEAVVEFLKNSKATFAGVWIQDGKLIAIRNEGRPLWKFEFLDDVIIASTKDIFIRSGITYNLTELEPLKIYLWNL